MSESGSTSSVYSGATSSTKTMESARCSNLSATHNEQSYLLYSGKEQDQSNIFARIWAFITGKFLSELQFSNLIILF